MSDRYRDRFGDYDRFGRRIGHQQRRYPRSTGGDIDYERSRYGREGTDWGTGTETSRSFYDRDYSTRDRDSMRDRERSWRGSDWGSRSGYARRYGRRGETDIEDYDIDRGYSGRYGREDYEGSDYGRRTGRVEESYGFGPEDYDQEDYYEAEPLYGNRYEREAQRRGWWDRASDEVASWFGDDEAKRRRRMDEIRQGLYRGRGPKGYQRSDSRIEEDVNDRLTDHPYIDASDIEVSVNSGEVVLAGTVDDRTSKRLAEAIAEEVSGVRNVENRLRMRSRRIAGPTVQPESESIPVSKSATTQRT